MSIERLSFIALMSMTIFASPGLAQDVGVAACDNFLKTYQSCVATKAPAQAQAQMKSTIEQVKKNWIAVAATPDGKKQLETTCKQTADQMKQQAAALNCAW